MVMLASMTACHSSEDSQNESSFPTATAPITPDSEAVQSTPPLNNESDRTLIAYFSLGLNAETLEGIDANASASLVLDGEDLVGTTEYIAQLIQSQAGGDLHSIQTAEAYPNDFDAVVDQNHEEMNSGTLPQLKTSDLDISQYDTVFIGYPIWATNAPQAIFSFFSEYDLSGKTIIPFCTHDGYGAGSSYSDIAQAVPDALEVLDGLAVKASDVPSAADTVAQWLEDIGRKESGVSNAQAGETAITITVGDTVLEGVLYNTALANEIKEYFPLTLSMSGYGGREYYGGVDFYPENLEGGQKTFENGYITYCEAHHNMAIFYAQTDHPVLSVDVIPIGQITSDLAVFDTLGSREEITFSLAE